MPQPKELSRPRYCTSTDDGPELFSQSSELGRSPLTSEYLAYSSSQILNVFSEFEAYCELVGVLLGVNYFRES